MWVSRAEITYLRNRVGKLEEQLELERHENREAERHFANMILRKAQSFPLSASPPAPARTAPRPRTTAERLGIDPGELEALRAEAKRVGLPPTEADRRLFAERGLEYSESEN